MKHLFLALMMTTLFTNFAFAEETETDCPMMSESTDRSVTKGTLAVAKPEQPTTKSGSSAQ